MATEVLRRRFTLDEYHRMGEAGIFTEDDRVELIDGEVVQMTPIGPRHASCVARLTRLLVRAVGDRAIVWAQNPARVPPDSEPQPDVALLAPRPDFYGSAHPGPNDMLLIIEVSESSLDYDRGVKRSLYARAAIAEFWIVDLKGQAIEICREPAGPQYRGTRRAQRGDTLSPQAFPDVTIRVDDILG